MEWQNFPTCFFFWFDETRESHYLQWNPGCLNVLFLEKRTCSSPQSTRSQRGKKVKYSKHSNFSFPSPSNSHPHCKHFQLELFNFTLQSHSLKFWVLSSTKTQQGRRNKYQDGLKRCIWQLWLVQVFHMQNSHTPTSEERPAPGTELHAEGTPTHNNETGTRPVACQLMFIANEREKIRSDRISAWWEGVNRLANDELRFACLLIVLLRAT